jgi:hypothetical protein
MADYRTAGMNAQPGGAILIAKGGAHTVRRPRPAALSIKIDAVYQRAVVLAGDRVQWKVRDIV